ncbi:ATP-dependent DNA helicase [Frankliniella fusca]|uniref:ATP-dependent DNA helicase n=1 Tax=Frankliniella fusca TaxID=407009 RepID=A0AAE1GYQ5_9NEOP|nr:ATP-dependent DNA helicase [Frankliniella fusca]
MRSKRLVIQFRNYKEAQDTLNFQRENLMLFTNWRTEPLQFDSNLGTNFKEQLEKIKQNRSMYCKLDTTFDDIDIDFMDDENLEEEEDESPNPTIISTAIDSCSGTGSKNAKHYMLSEATRLSHKQTQNLKYELLLCNETKYIVSVNIAVPDGISNGSSCVLKAIIMGALQERGKDTGRQAPIRVYVQFPDAKTGEKRRERLRDFFRKDKITDRTWTPIERINRSFTVTKSSQLQVTRNQLPILPSNAQTIHCSQSCTYQKIAVYVNGLSRKLLYTAISRVTSLRGLYIVGTYKPPDEATIHNDPALNEMIRMKIESQLKLTLTFPEDVKNSSNVMIIFHNVRSLHLHFKNVSNDRSFLACDVIMLAETWSLPTDKYDIDNYTIVFRTDCKSEKRKAFGTVIYVKDNVLPNLEIIFQNETVSVGNNHSTVFAMQLHEKCLMMVYKSPKAPWTMLQQQMKTMLQVCQSNNLSEICIMGDFNIRYQISESNYVELTNFMQANNLFMLLDQTKVSTDHNSLIDLCLSTNTSLRADVFESVISDHKPIWLELI